MAPDSLLLQLAFSVPITLGLVVYTLVRRDRTPLHALAAALLGSVAVWLIAMAVHVTATSPAIVSAAVDIELMSILVMPPLFVVTMGYFARSPLFEQSRAASIAVFSIFGLFGVAYWSDGAHHLFISDRAALLAGERPEAWGGPLYWGLQTWCAIADLVAIGLCTSALVRGRNASERLRAAMVLGAIFAPIAAHFAFVLEWLPLENSPAPATIGATAVFFVLGVRRYGLLEGQPIVRHDVIEHIEDGLVIANPDGVVLDANAAAESVVRCNRTTLRGRSLGEVLLLLDPEEDVTPLVERIEAIALGGRRVNGDVRSRDGRFLEITAGAVSAIGTQPAGRFLSLRDRSAQRRGEMLLRERQKLESVGILAAGIAHEVNNPLAYVRANLSHLLELSSELGKHVRFEESDRAPELLEFPDLLVESLEGLDRIRHIVESMLRFSRVADDAARPIDLNQVVEDALRLAALKRSSAIRVVPRLDPDLPAVLGSPERLVQVLLNLLLNAKQALGDRPDAQITAETGVDLDRVVVHVRDNGPGIPEADQERIFDPFYTTRAPNEGTGLGLAIAFEIAREHRGTLELDSRLGRGSCFTLRLPIAPATNADR